MIYSFYENIFKYLKIGFTYLSKDLKVIYFNKEFKSYIVDIHNPIEKCITELIPETVGLEDNLFEIASGNNKSLNLKYFAREDENGKVFYFNLLFYATEDPEKPIICLIENITDLATKEQKILQQQNEILLLESYLLSRGEFLFASILGSSEPIRNIQKMVAKISSVSFTTVLLLGESGTGKSLVAKVIHYSSQESKKPFVEINCAAIPESLLESELFGYEKGAFTGAVEKRRGLLEEANGGTLFLDEIGELPLKLQAKLLTFLESRKFRPLGSNKVKEVKVRLITATNRDLNEMKKNGEFREDLLYRLKVITFNLPPLRELGTDIITFANHFIHIYNIEFNKHVKTLSKDAERVLLNYRWPGNVRELSNVIERAMIFIESDVINVEDLNLHSDGKNTFSSKWTVPPEGISLDQVERDLIFSALEKSGGNKSHASRLLGLSRDTFCYRLAKYKPE